MRLLVGARPLRGHPAAPDAGKAGITNPFRCNPAIEMHELLSTSWTGRGIFAHPYLTTQLTALEKRLSREGEIAPLVI